MTLNDAAWETLFNTYNILPEIRRNGFYEIDAGTIKTVREPRLMAKFDHSSNLPRIFKENGISILPISRSKYVLGEFDAYCKVTYNSNLKPVSVSLPSHLASIDPANLYSESAALHCAYAAGMIDDLLGERSVPTVSGRMSSQQFDFYIRTKSGAERLVHIKNAQIEIDGGFESENQLMIVEAKNESVDDFLVRQLYYPYRLWNDKLQKRVKPVFFTYSNDVFSFFVFEFAEPMKYNSLRLVEQRNYILAHEAIERSDIVELLHTTPVVPEPNIPFPQADSFARIVDLLGLLVENGASKDFITANYDFDTRQTNYYTSAAMYLGLVERYVDEANQVMFALSDKGRAIMNKPYKPKYLALASAILEHEVFRQVLRQYLETGRPLPRERVVGIMAQCGLYNVRSDSTYFRRASTVMKWVEWIVALQH